MIFSCCDVRRLEVLRRSGTRNAIEFLEVLDHSAPPGVPRQQTLFVRLLHPNNTLTPDNLRITGGERIPTVGIVWAAPGDDLPPEAEPGLVDGVDELPRTLVIRTASSGDFSRYTLVIVASSGSDTPPADFDPLLASIQFSFKVECPSDFDCAAPLPCPSASTPLPRIDYLAKDYQGFRRLLLDRLSLLAPGWTERSAADLGIALVELLAFASDTLSYRQDVIANEAYLNTARQRVSVRRHARLVDYYLHEGCNARAFVHFEVARGASDQVLPRGSRLLTRALSAPTVVEPGSREERQALDAGVLIFETVHEQTLRESLNRLSFYTWGDTGCCLPRGATSATLQGHAEHLQPGDFLVFREEVSPTTFDKEDADQAHRHVVRLARVVLDEDPIGRLFEEPPVDAPAPITRIEWDAADALPFALCVSVVTRPGLEVSAALGNIVLADHGETIPDEVLAALPSEQESYASIAHTVADCCKPPAVVRLPLRYRPLLRRSPLTHGFDHGVLLAATLDSLEGWWSAAALRALDARQATPRIALVGKQDAQEETWTPQRDLLGSDADAADFTVEVQDDGRARLRFGDDARGRRPDEATSFVATYRAGNGVAGNVGAEAIAHLVMTPGLAIDSIFNPLPAFGGVDPEDIEAVRRDAPQAFRTQERAVNGADYAAAAERRADVQRAAASFRWTGSWHTVFVTADRMGGAAVDARFETGLRRHLERFRMAGYDLEVDSPRFVALDLALHVCVKPEYFRSEVIKAVRDVLSSTLLPDGRRGVFHPDNFTFGLPVYSSRILAAAQAVDGVESVRFDKFQRLVAPGPASIEDGVIPIGRLEIAQLENNPNFRDRGRLVLTAGGGK
jgi:Baseplate J-like protein